MTEPAAPISQRDQLLYQADYAIWSDQKALAAAATVPAESYHRDFGFSFGTVHKTLLHMLGAQNIWLGRFQGNSTLTFPTVEQIPDLIELQTRWKATHDSLRRFIENQSADTLALEVEFTRNGVTQRQVLGRIILHCLDHATYHKGQLNSLIKLACGQPAAFGVVEMLREKGGIPS